MTPLAGKLIAILKAHPNEWLSRLQIARAAGVKSLSASGRAALDELADSRVIERRITVQGVSKERKEYRLSSGD